MGKNLSFFKKKAFRNASDFTRGEKTKRQIGKAFLFLKRQVFTHFTP